MSSDARHLVTVLLLAAAGSLGVLGINQSWLAPGAMSDAVEYLTAAQSFEEHGQFEIPVSEWNSPDSVARLAHYPPGLSMLISVPMDFGFRLYPSALVVMAISSGLALAFAYLLASELGGPWAGLLSALMLFIMPVCAKINLSVWSEPSYVAATLAMLYVMVSRPRWAWAYGFLAAAGVAIRYVGVAGVATATLWAGVQGGTRRERIALAATAAGPSLGFLAFWHHYVAAGGGTVRTIGWYGGLGPNLVQFRNMLIEWLVPTGSSGAGWVVVGALSLAFTMLLAVRGTDLWQRERACKGLGLLAAFVAFYTATVVASRLFVDPFIPFDARLFLPVLVLGVLAFAISAVHVVNHQHSGRPPPWRQPIDCVGQRSGWLHAPDLARGPRCQSFGTRRHGRTGCVRDVPHGRWNSLAGGDSDRRSREGSHEVDTR